MSENRTVTGETVDVRRFQDGVAHATERIESLIVSDHQDDVGTLGRSQTTGSDNP
jgi:hypothetical protein